MEVRNRVAVRPLGNTAQSSRNVTNLGVLIDTDHSFVKHFGVLTDAYHLYVKHFFQMHVAPAPFTCVASGGL